MIFSFGDPVIISAVKVSVRSITASISVADVVVPDGFRSVAEVDGAGFGEAGEDVGVDRVGHVDGGHGRGSLSGDVESKDAGNGVVSEDAVVAR